jgi:putative ABC transport system substrate-binding protein
MRLAALVLCIGLAGGSHAAPVVGVLEASGPDTFPERIGAFKQGLRDLGHIEGKTVHVEYRWASGKVEDLRRLASELMQRKVDVIFAPTTSTALAVREASDAVPIVFAVVADPVGVGLAASLARPGGNATGLTTVNVSLASKRLQILTEIAGRKPSRLGLLHNPRDASNVLALRAVTDAGRAIGIETHPLPVTSPEQFAAAFVAARTQRVDAFLVAAGAGMDSEAPLVTKLAAEARLPAIYAVRDYVEAGGLVSYSASFADNYRRAAAYVDRILRGAKPGELAIEQSSTFELAINLKAARALGLQVPQALLVSATRVIE